MADATDLKCAAMLGKFPCIDTLLTFSQLTGPASQNRARIAFDCQTANESGHDVIGKIVCALMSFWIAYAIVFVAWWALYFFVSDKMTDAGIGWINAINPHSDTQYSLASKLTIAKHVVFAVLMIVALVFLARHYPS